LEHDGEAQKRATRSSASPHLSLVPERLRRKRLVGHSRRRAPSVGRTIAVAAALQINRVLSQSFLPERFRDYAFGGASLPSLASRRALLRRTVEDYQPRHRRSKRRRRARYFLSVRIQPTSSLTSASGVVTFG